MRKPKHQTNNQTLYMIRDEEIVPEKTIHAIVHSIAKAIAPVILSHLVQVEWRLGRNATPTGKTIIEAAAKEGKIDLDSVSTSLEIFLADAKIDGMSLMQLLDEAINSGMQSKVTEQAKKMGMSDDVARQVGEMLDDFYGVYTEDADSSRGSHWV